MKYRDIKLHRVIAIMDRDEIDYLDKIGKDSLFTTGVKLSRIKILRAMVDAMKELNINGKNVKSEENLKDEILKRVTAYSQHMAKGLLVLILALNMLALPILPAYCKGRSVSKTLTMTLRVVARADLEIGADKLTKEGASLNTMGAMKKISSNQKDLTVSRVYRDGMETILITRISE